MTTEKRLPGYGALVLTDESAATLRVMAIHNDVFCHHMTLVFRPTPVEWAEFEPLVGQQFEVVVVGIAQDHRGQAVRVSLPDGLRSHNEPPFVTISCAPGTNPVYSKKLFATMAIAPAQPLVLTGTVEFVSFF